MHRFARRAILLAALLAAGLARAQPLPAGDFHQHVFSPADIALLGPGAGLRAMDAQELVGLLDAAGMRRAVLLSVAYLYGSPARQVEQEAARVRLENDWTAAQAARYPGRLIAFCSFNPLKDYALDELARCARHPGLGHGIKLHFANSDVQLDLPEHVARLRQVFAAANAHHMAIVVHMRANLRNHRPYGAEQARIFLEQLLPAAPDVTVQVAHFAGAGPGFEDAAARAAMAVLADAVRRGDARTRRLWFDLASIATPGMPAATQALVAERIREVGVERVVYGSDSPQGGNLAPREAWAAFLDLPLTREEFTRIAANVPPYFP